MSQRSLLGAFRQIGLLTGASRILGFGRDVAFATFLGAGPLADAFLVALKLPNMFRRLSAEGALTNAFVPSFSHIRAADGNDAAMKLAAEVQILLTLILLVIVVLAEFFMVDLVRLLAPGFVATQDRFDAAVALGRITMPYLPLISLVALWSAIANAHDHFAAGAIMPIFFNLCLIVGAMALPVMATGDVVTSAMPLAVALLVAGVVQLAVMFVILRRFGGTPAWIFPRLTAAGRAMWRKFTPAALAATAMQVNMLVDLILASLLPVGAISWLYYADRIVQLPLGIIGIALGTALLPKLSKAEAEQDQTSVGAILNDGIGLAGFFVIPAVTALICIAEPIISGLFAYGAFSAADAVVTALALQAYALGLLGFVATKLFQPAFYAAGQPATVLKISLLAVLVNVAGSLILMRIYGHVGLAIATSFSGVMAALMLGILLVRKGKLVQIPFGLIGRLCVASAFMAAGLLGTRQAMPDLPHALALVLLVVVGVVLYLAASVVLKTIPKGILRSRS
ncbi:MAG: murein biosynthesis integral membrane protein MurJ [Candidatus Puniceispirillum sp.]|uniref:murein biosynthesis integral membrane protein MurJ n=1 Tax=Candidatus Puniceispirillum sp. TaxID=2026719 RepID=UPI001EC48C54|nr:murein biosynthesis integral membrane protein MurJ [Candidatus Puniceispirillum sp.]MBT6416572.1 murein biosynthesis integral membrane protein MurJ [Candidatus Puniceispirillum sp.]